ncbi:ABC-2 type transport system permease protein [Natranaerovirga hydrolytica]|uniref:ABC-2 type transport system permease protein n=1 Tax=Natranaerovirga hydrolytica TaxID=680378 RepID=A0A4R1MMX3_9FIRM|nr:ABC transporter permease [Natranaerovirga hydrolytica]TCK92644.1 ABC-2 type transport system permease protein [Natranaerovirga hydrolytica]
MKHFISHNFHRLFNKKHYIILSFVMILVSIFMSIHFSSTHTTKVRIAVVTEHEDWGEPLEGVQITMMKESPPRSQLVLGQYDGVIIEQDNGEYGIETIKNNAFKTMLKEMVENPKSFMVTPEQTRGFGTNVIGYLLMVILFQSMLFMFVFAEDIQFKQIERIAKAPVSLTEYILSHFIAVFILIFVPVLSFLIVAKGILGLDIGLSLWQYGYLIGVMTILGVAFAMFIHSLVKGLDTANMVGSSIVILTTILSGSFYAFERGNELFNKILWVLPQKTFLNFVQNVEEGMGYDTMVFQIMYVWVVAVCFLMVTIKKIKKDYILGKS